MVGVLGRKATGILLLVLILGYILFVFAVFKMRSMQSPAGLDARAFLILATWLPILTKLSGIPAKNRLNRAETLFNDGGVR